MNKHWERDKRMIQMTKDDLVSFERVAASQLSFYI